MSEVERLKAEVEELKAARDTWYALAEHHRASVFELHQQLRDLQEEVDGLYEQASELKYD